MVSDLEGYRWDAILLSETWRHEPAEMWETHHKHIFMGSGKFDNKHGLGMMLNKRWRQRIIDTEYINERAITTTVVVNRQHIGLMSVYFTHSRYADHHIDQTYKTIEKPWRTAINTYPSLEETSMLSLGPSNGTECKSVGRYTLNEGNKRGDWLKHWLMSQDNTALNTMY